jgi:hypothetical protein
VNFLGSGGNRLRFPSALPLFKVFH